LRKGESPVLPGEEREKEEGRWAQVERDSMLFFFFSGVFKTYTTQWEGWPGMFPPNNERVGRGMGGPQPGEGGLVHPQATYMR
jgi:hypothetical protein